MVDLSKTIRIEPKRRSATSSRDDLNLDLRDLSARSELETALFDWSSAPELQAELLAACAADAPPARPAASDALGTTAVIRPPPAVLDLAKTVVIRPPASALDPGKTLVIAPSSTAERAPVPPLAPGPAPATLDATIYDGGALREFAQQRAAEADHAARPAADAGRHRSGARLPASLAFTWRRLGVAASERYRATPRSKRLALALLLCTLGVAAAGKLPLFPRHDGPATVEHTLVRPPARTATPKRTEPPSAAHAVTPAPSPTPPAAPPDAELARAALRAAFDGNTREAVAAYERLDATAGGETFKLAARLLREGRVRRP